MGGAGTDGVRGSTGRGKVRVLAAGAAVALVAVLVVGVTVVVRRGEAAAPAAQAVVSFGDLRTTLEVSTVEPDLDTVVTATVTVANHGEDEVQVPAACRLTVAVVTDPPDQLRFPSGSRSLSYLAEGLGGSGLFRPEDHEVNPTLTIDDLVALGEGDVGPVAGVDPCDGDEPSTMLEPGGSIRATKKLVIGSLGLRGDAEVTTMLPMLSEEGNPAIAIRLPEPTTRSISRSDAITLALAQPEVVSLVESLPADDTPVDVGSAVIVLPVSDGWQVGYVDPRDRAAFLVDVSSDGVATSVVTRTPPA